jgi:hypothetical protein
LVKIALQTAAIGPWTISASHKAGDLNGCAMSRSTEGMDITFLHTRDSVLLLLQSQKWNLERGKSYAVRVAAGPRSVEAKALAETKTVRIALTDRVLLTGIPQMNPKPASIIRMG